MKPTTFVIILLSIALSLCVAFIIFWNGIIIGVFESSCYFGVNAPTLSCDFSHNKLYLEANENRP